MRTKIALILLIVLLSGAMPIPAAAEEELFDTQTAAAFLEKGLASLRQRNYDAAISAFEDAVSAAPDADAYYLLGYAFYLKGKTGDAESRKKAAENFSQAYQINPNFSPNKFKPEELTAPGAETGEASVGDAAPAGKRDSRPAVQPKTEPTGTPSAP